MHLVVCKVIICDIFELSDALDSHLKAEIKAQPLYLGYFYNLRS